jgi:hypothetical protein
MGMSLRSVLDFRLAMTSNPVRHSERSEESSRIEVHTWESILAWILRFAQNCEVGVSSFPAEAPNSKIQNRKSKIPSRYSAEAHEVLEIEEIEPGADVFAARTDG